MRTRLIAACLVICTRIVWAVDSATPAPVLFTDVTAESGIRFKHEDGRSGRKYFVETLGSGAAWFDYDRDGDVDVYLVNGAALPGKTYEIAPTNVLYANDGEGRFTDVTKAAGVGDTGYGFTVAVGDFDNDGFSDLYIANFGPNVLYRNNGDGTFSDATEVAGVGDSDWAASAAFADYDLDGDLDLFVGNYVEYSLEDDPECGSLDVRLYCSPEVFQPSVPVLYRNNGDGTFTDVTEEAGMSLVNKTMGLAWCSFDGDPYPDLFIANDRTENRLYQHGDDGRFMDVALFAGLAYYETGVALSSMAAIWGDVDNDGRFDLFLTNFRDEPHTLYHNDGDGFFSDVSFASGLGSAGLAYLSWGAELADFNNDGHSDLFVANGHLDDNIQDLRSEVTYAQQNQIFLNRGDGTFADVSDTAGDALLVAKVSRGVAVCDFDDDGDLDVLVTNANQDAQLLRNDTPRNGHWIALDLRGTSSNRDAIGARVGLTAGGTTQIREVRSAASYPSHRDMRLHFGLGGSELVDAIEIRWPGGAVERYEKVEADRLWRVVEGGDITVLPN